MLFRSKAEFHLWKITNKISRNQRLSKVYHRSSPSAASSLDHLRRDSMLLLFRVTVSEVVVAKNVVRWVSEWTCYDDEVREYPLLQAMGVNVACH